MFHWMSSEAISKLWLLPHRKDSFYMLCCFMNICRCFTAYCGYVAWYGLWIILIIRVWTFIIAHSLVPGQCTCLVPRVPIQLRELVDQGLSSSPATHPCVPGQPARLHRQPVTQSWRPAARQAAVGSREEVKLSAINVSTMSLTWLTETI